MSFDQAQVASLIRKIGRDHQILAETYTNGTVFIDDNNQSLIDSLKKNGLLRIADHSDEFRLTSEIKRLIDHLLRRNLNYRLNTDMAKMVANVADDIDAYRQALEQNEQEEANHHLELIDDNLYESLELLENSLSVMFSAITSQFGFVNSLSSKIRENKRALSYAQQLVKELNYININECYDWISSWSAPAELSNKVIRFIDHYKDIVVRLASIVDRMKSLLFTLRLQEQTANRTRAMAQFLKQHPEWNPREWSEESIVPNLFMRDKGLILTSGINSAKSSLQNELIHIVQELKRQTTAVKLINKNREAMPVDSSATVDIEYPHDFFEDHIETLFTQVLEKRGHKISALQYWKMAALSIKPSLWLDIVFAQHCCLQKRFKQRIALDLEGENLADYNGNQLISEIYLRRVQ